MKPQNSYLAKRQVKRNARDLGIEKLSLQMAADAAVIALKNTRGCSEETAVEFLTEMVKVYDEIIDLFHADTKDTEYSRAKVDEALRRILGDNMQPWEERYGKC
jgi:hypothetical protein